MTDAERKAVRGDEEFKMVEINLIEKKGNEKVTFVLGKSTPAKANALRRVLIGELPVMAVDTVEISKNSSLLYDEMIALRVGLIPLTTDLKSYNLPSKCKCEGKGCARCQVKLSLKAKGPCTVYASELESDDKAIKPFYPKIPIVHLLKNQSLELEATAVLGLGNVHAKWSAGHAYYVQYPSIETKESKSPCAKCEKYVQNCPAAIFDYKNNKVVVKDKNYYKWNIAEVYADACPEHITITPTNDFVFFVESFGQLDVKSMIVESVKLLQEQMEEFAESIKAIK